MEEQKTIFSYLFQADTKKAQEQVKALNEEANILSKSMSSAFDQIVVKGRDVESVFKSLALGISKQSFQKAIMPAEAGLGSTLGFDVGGIFKSIFGFAKGGAFPGGVGGGGIGSAIGFPLGGGNFGVAGEAGPEAILPLSRGANGELGVRSSGGGGPVNVTINIATPDVEGFRRSEGELAASLQRIVNRGNRNL